MAYKYYKDLQAWQASMDLATIIYKNIKSLPKEELYSLSDQIRRAAVSVPSNIAEGQQRNSQKEFLHFLYVAKGSLAELETQVLLCERLQFFTHEQTELILNQCGTVGKLLNGLITSIQNRLSEAVKHAADNN